MDDPFLCTLHDTQCQCKVCGNSITFGANIFRSFSQKYIYIFASPQSRSINESSGNCDKMTTTNDAQERKKEKSKWENFTPRTFNDLV